MRNKVFIFIIGFVAGISIGVLFSVAIKALLSKVREMDLSLNKINLKQTEMSQRLDSIQGKLVPDAKKSASSNTAKYTPQQPGKSTVNTPVKSTSPISPNTGSATISQDSDVEVMTNQLLTVTSVSLLDKDTAKADKKNQETDSTIAAMSEVGVSEEPKEYRVEFWKSPLNYKGYKMSRGKIVIYGLTPAGGLMWLSKDNDNYYLVNGQTPYKLEFTDDFKPLEQVTDKATLKKLRL
jgi:hypothetical protein